MHNKYTKLAIHNAHHTHTHTILHVHYTCTHTTLLVRYTTTLHTHTTLHYTHTLHYTTHTHNTTHTLHHINTLHTLHYTHAYYTKHTRMHACMHTFNGLSEDNSRVLDLKNCTNDTTSAATIVLVPSEIPAKKFTVKL